MHIREKVQQGWVLYNQTHIKDSIGACEEGKLSQTMSVEVLMVREWCVSQPVCCLKYHGPPGRFPPLSYCMLTGKRSTDKLCES